MAFNFVCETAPVREDDGNDCPEDQCTYDECLHFTSQVWLAPFDFGILQQVTLKFKPAEEEKGFLEVHVSLTRESGESNAWLRINRTFLHEVRKQLLLWRSFDDDTKAYYEGLLSEAAARAADGA
jgi:hypothetical protein